MSETDGQIVLTPASCLDDPVSVTHLWIVIHGLSRDERSHITSECTSSATFLQSGCAFPDPEVARVPQVLDIVSLASVASSTATMVAPVVLLAVLGCLAAPALASGDPTEKLPGVNDLSAENFSTFVTGTKAALVEFYAPWCGHCKHLVPEYKKLGEIVQNDPKLKNRVVIAKVDADKHRSVGEQFGVQGFPTIKFFPRGKAPTKDNARDYNGARTAEAFVEFLQKELEADKGFARVKALDELTKSFLTAADKAAVVKQVTDKVAELSGADKDNGAVYVKLMQKGIEKGNDWLGKEKARLEKMLSSGSVSMLKVAELGSKVSVLGHILGDDE